MSAPLVVNTTDGTVWLRRASTRGGLELYAPADVCVCPEFVMATLAELAEHGIAGSADVVPVPVGPEPQPLSAEQRSALAELIGDVKPANAKLLHAFGECVRDCREHEHPKASEDFHCLNLSAWMGERAALVLRRLLDAEARIAKLEAERHSTNEALDDAVKALRARREDDDPARCLKAHEFSPRDGWRMVCSNCDHGKDADCHQGGDW